MGQKVHVTVHVEPASSGCSVAEQPAGNQHDPGTIVTLTAQAAAGFEFDHWEGDASGTDATFPLTLNENATVNAIFRALYSLTVTAANGTVQTTPDQPRYGDGTAVELRATPSGGYLFDHWSGDLTGTANPATLTLDDDKSVTAVFVVDYIEDEDSTDTSEADELVDPDAVVHQQAGGQKYLHLAVPNYDENTTSATAPRTYLQLGACPDSSSDPRHWGDDMLDRVGVPTTATAYFKDDFRYDHSQTHPQTKYARWDGVSRDDTTDPLTLSGELRTRGGWRQHTDGNLISTTRGDRVDVYYGNYKMVVLGRMDVSSGNWGETYWESSGGHTRWATNTQGDLVLVRWNADRSRWRTHEETIRGDLIDRYQGIQEEIYEGPRRVTMIGSPDPATTDIPGVSKDPHTQLTSDADGAATDHYPPAYAGKWVSPGGRKKERPDVTERIDAGAISELTKVTSDLATRATECSDSALAASALLDVSGFAKGDDLDFTAGRPPVGAIVAKKSVATRASEETFSTWGRVYEKLTVDSGVTITEETGFAPVDAPSGTDDAVRVDHVSDLLFCFGKVSSDITASTKLSGFGGWTFNFSLVGAAVDLGFGATVTVPHFTRWEGYFRTEVGLSFADTLDIDFALSADVNVVVANLKIFAGQKVEGDFSTSRTVCVLAGKVSVDTKESDLVDLPTVATETETSANNTST